MSKLKELRGVKPRGLAAQPEPPAPLPQEDTRHANPSGLPPEERKPQPVPPEHHEEGSEV